MHHWSTDKVCESAKLAGVTRNRGAGLGETKKDTAGYLDGKPTRKFQVRHLVQPSPPLPATPRHDLWIILPLYHLSGSKYYFYGHGGCSSENFECNEYRVELVMEIFVVNCFFSFLFSICGEIYDFWDGT